MSETEKKKKKKSISLDWLVGGVLTKVGDTFDRVTGRGWNPSSSLATSKLVEKLKFLLDEEARKSDSGVWYVPHILMLKIQWNKFSSDGEGEMDKLTYELHAAAIDHINDNLYHTYAPIEIDVKTDYFTEGVRLTGSFGDFGGEGDEEAAVNVTLPSIKVEHIPEGSRVSINLEAETPKIDAKPVYAVSFVVNGKSIEKILDFAEAKRFSVGRVKENEIAIDHSSVSKVHAALVLNDEGKLLLADTGSTNGTYVNNTRIAYGKAIEVSPEMSLKFGTVLVSLAAQFIPGPDLQIDETEAFIAPDDVVAGIPAESSVIPEQQQFLEESRQNVSESDISIPQPPISEVSVDIAKEGSSGEWADFGVKKEVPVSDTGLDASATADDWSVSKEKIDESPGVERDAGGSNDESKEDWEI
jgi:pSer/pThr/pTyr-binding forkhead associated (FHA) protein